MFLDHYKPAYTTDLKLCEELGLVAKRSVLAADNVIKPGNPPYLEYVRSSVQEKRERAKKANNGGGNDIEAFADRAAQQYKKRIEKEDLGVAYGNPNLIYESRLVDSFEPTGEPDGVEISRCVGEEK
jgi:catechol O-methyltransferase